MLYSSIVRAASDMLKRNGVDEVEFPLGSISS
jgi:hypothetical protein